MRFPVGHIASHRTKTINTPWLMPARKYFVTYIAFVDKAVFTYLLRGCWFFYNAFALDALARGRLEIWNSLGTKKFGVGFPKFIVGNRMAGLAKGSQVASGISFPQSSKNSVRDNMVAINSNPRNTTILACVIISLANFPGNLSPIFTPIRQIPFHYSIIALSGGLYT